MHAFCPGWWVCQQNLPVNDQLADMLFELSSEKMLSLKESVIVAGVPVLDSNKGCIVSS